MVVVAHALVAPPWSNGRSMVISSLLYEQFNVFGLCQFFLRKRTRHVCCFRPLLCTLFMLNWATQTPGQ